MTGVAAEDVAIQVPTPGFKEFRRKGPLPERSVEFQAFRDLANETARRAIGVYATQTHRRNAVTKVIVSTLAGVTSLWLMLDSPDWRDLQFITACVSLFAAAYWVGQAYRTLMDLLHAGDYDRPEIDEAEAEWFVRRRRLMSRRRGDNGSARVVRRSVARRLWGRSRNDGARNRARRRTSSKSRRW